MSGASMPRPNAKPAMHLRLRGKADTQELGKALAGAVQPGDLVVLEGSLGAGKTFLVQAIARALGVPHSQPVTSPTFEIVHEFSARVPIVHADLYRLDPAEPLAELGLDARIGNDAVVLVEWGERFAAQLGDDGLWVFLRLLQGNQRGCELEARGERGKQLLARLIPLLSASSLGTR
jgi:tRNA threonylcarbamoyladenosine biosynthesis protein TsaE